jgi:hypothetical protein
MLAQYGIGPLPHLGELGHVRVAVEADPAGCGGPAGRGGVQCIGDGSGEIFKAGGEIQIAADSGAVKTAVDLRDLTAQSGDLDSQGGPALTQSLSGRFSLRAGHRLPSLRPAAPAAR